MKGNWKKILIAFLTVWLISFSGCAQLNKSSEFKTQENRLELEGNPTTGYTWIYIIDDESVISIKEKIRYLGKKNVVGAPSLFTYTIKSLKPGTTTLRFEYKRPWETEPAEEIKLYEVQVNETGMINLTEKQ